MVCHAAPAHEYKQVFMYNDQLTRSGYPLRRVRERDQLRWKVWHTCYTLHGIAACQRIYLVAFAQSLLHADVMRGQQSSDVDI